jgi:hypothetical protein
VTAVEPSPSSVVSFGIARRRIARKMSEGCFSIQTRGVSVVSLTGSLNVENK